MKIFISHSSKNKDFGNALVELLRKVGIKENEIIFTSNIAYGIPVGQNIFNWLKSQITEKPFVIYLLSEEYYESIACLNEMGAAWIVENEHAAIFTPNFNLSSKEFQSGVLDPREIGFHINDEERVLSFIELLSRNFEITTNAVLISQSIKKFIQELENIKPIKSIKKVPEKPESSKIVTDTSTEKTVVQRKKEHILPKDNDLYSKFIKAITNKKMRDDELLLIHYIKETGRSKLMTGWQENKEILFIVEWEKINNIKEILSQNYPSVLNRFELRGFTEVSEITSSNKPKEVKLKDEIATNILDLPEDAVKIIDEVIERNFHEYADEPEIENGFPF